MNLLTSPSCQLFIYPLTSLSRHLSLSPRLAPEITDQGVYLTSYLSIQRSIYLFTYPSVYLSTCVLDQFVDLAEVLLLADLSMICLNIV